MRSKLAEKGGICYGSEVDMPRIKQLRVAAGVWLGIGLVAGIGFHWGYSRWQLGRAGDLETIRLSGYRYISPLLICNAEDAIREEQWLDLEGELDNYIANQTDQGILDKGSVYFRQLNTGNYVAVNPEERYYPASLNKIPVMMTAYKMAEADPKFLEKAVTATDSADYNRQQEVKPADWVKMGQKLTMGEVTEKLIRYSDNNAYYLLAQYLNPAVYEKTHRDLRIPLEKDGDDNPDYVTAEEMSYFMRVLYNSTYLDREYSEKALELLTKVDFSDGLVKGVKPGIQIAHKFGLYSQAVNGQIESRELHECGIIYQPNNPYLLCVMTKGKELEELKRVLGEISTLVANRTGG